MRLNWILSFGKVFSRRTISLYIELSQTSKLLEDGATPLQTLLEYSYHVVQHSVCWVLNQRNLLPLYLLIVGLLQMEKKIISLIWRKIDSIHQVSDVNVNIIPCFIRNMNLDCKRSNRECENDRKPSMDILRYNII